LELEQQAAREAESTRGWPWDSAPILGFARDAAVRTVKTVTRRTFTSA
jgi:hypothetical protein